MTARRIGRFLAPLFRRLFNDRRGDLQTHLLLTAAGCTMVGLAAPSLFNSSQKCSATFDKQVSMLENGASPGGAGSMGGLSGISGAFSQFGSAASSLSGFMNSVSGTVNAVQGTVSAVKSGNVAGAISGVAGAANGMAVITNGGVQTTQTGVATTPGGATQTVSTGQRINVADAAQRAAILRGLATH